MYALQESKVRIVCVTQMDVGQALGKRGNKPQKFKDAIDAAPRITRAAAEQARRARIAAAISGKRMLQREDPVDETRSTKHEVCTICFGSVASD